MKTVMIKIDGKEVEAEILQTFMRGVNNYAVRVEGVKYLFQYDTRPSYSREFYSYREGYLIKRGNKPVITTVWLKHLQ